MMRKRKGRGQSLVEFALVITLIFMLVSGAIDFGLAFFAFQGISGAAAEGAAYGALVPSVNAGGTSTPNNAEIRRRVVNEAGTATNTLPNQARFVNFFDLDNDGDADTPAERDTMVIVRTIPNAVGGGVNCADNRRLPQFCDIEVEVQYRYEPFFAAAGAFGAEFITLRARRRATIGG